MHWLHSKLQGYYHLTRCKLCVPTAISVDSLTIFPFLNQQETLSNLKKELPSYLAKCSDVATLKCHCNGMVEAVEGQFTEPTKVFFIQPSSAAAEVVFSLLNASFSEQKRSLKFNDYVETSIMLQYI